MKTRTMKNCFQSLWSELENTNHQDDPCDELGSLIGSIVPGVEKRIHEYFVLLTTRWFGVVKEREVESTERKQIVRTLENSST